MEIIFRNNIVPIEFIKQTQRETNIIDKTYTEDELIDIAIKYSKDKINGQLKDGEYIKKYKILEEKYTKTSISLSLFFCVIENITSYEEIMQEENPLN